MLNYFHGVNFYVLLIIHDMDFGKFFENLFENFFENFPKVIFSSQFQDGL